MSAIPFMLTAALAVATPANNPAHWTNDLQYPPIAMRSGGDLTVDFSLLVSPEGKVARCDIIESSGLPDFDRQTCVALTNRAKFKPATDEQGQAVHNIYNGIISMGLKRHGGAPSGRRPSLRAADIELQVQRLPNGALEESVGIVTKVDPTGHVILCEPASPEQSSARLTEIACAQAQASYAAIQTDGDGKPVTMIRSLRVTFKVAAK